MSIFVTFVTFRICFAFAKMCCDCLCGRFLFELEHMHFVKHCTLAANTFCFKNRRPICRTKFSAHFVRVERMELYPYPINSFTHLIQILRKNLSDSFDKGKHMRRTCIYHMFNAAVSSKR